MYAKKCVNLRQKSSLEKQRNILEYKLPYLVICLIYLVFVWRTWFLFGLYYIFFGVVGVFGIGMYLLHLELRVGAAFILSG